MTDQRITEIVHKLFEKDAFVAEALSTDKPLPHFKQTIKAANVVLKQLFVEKVPVSALVPAMAQFVDCILQTAWQLHIKDNQHMAMIAVGGYGRGELHPGSDVDILILMDDSVVESLSPDVEKLVMFLWDIGLYIGHSVRTPDECVSEARNDITIATNLMEARCLAGSRNMFESLMAKTGPDKIWPSKDFFNAKMEEQLSRHKKFDDTSYQLEPNVKEGPGGLRDIQIIGWVAKRHFGAQTLHDLVNLGFLTENEYKCLNDGENFLWAVRFALHSITNRAEDRMLFDHQVTVAQQFGYANQDNNLAVEQFMQTYYLQINELRRLNEMLLQLFQEAILLKDEAGEPVALNKRFQAVNGFLEVKQENTFSRYPMALLEMFLMMQKHPELKGVKATTIRLVRENLGLIDESFRDDIRNKSLFMEIMRDERHVTRELRRMHRYGVLGAYLPNFEAITGRMQYDLYHHYTVDQHTLFVMRNIRFFTLPKYAQQYPFQQRVMREVPKQHILLIAALFHDIAKGRGGDHSELGTVDALSFCQRHGMSTYDTNLVAWLVRQHLLMSTTAQKKDISDPSVVQEFASKVRDVNYLNCLYLLTVADMQGTSPKVWNGWKDSLLMELYNSTKRLIRRGLNNPVEGREMVQETQGDAIEELIKKGCNPAQIDRLWSHMHDDYFLRYPAEDIVWHTEALLAIKPSEMPLVLTRNNDRRGGTEVFLCAKDVDDVFARSVIALDAMRLNIQDARIISSRSGYTLNSYLVLDENEEPIESTTAQESIRQRLREDLLADTDIPTMAPKPLSRRARSFDIKTQVIFNEDEENQRTIMELVTHDQPGLLARVGFAFARQGIRVQNAKILTQGEKVEDIFYITNRNNEPVSDEETRQAIRETLLACIKPSETAA